MGGRCRGDVAFLATESHVPVNKPTRPLIAAPQSRYNGLGREWLGGACRVCAVVTKTRPAISNLEKDRPERALFAIPP